MLGLEMGVVLGVALLLSGLLARRFPIAPALLLVLIGVLIGFVPRLSEVQLPPEVVLLLASTGLVVATAGAPRPSASSPGRSRGAP